MSNTTNKEKLSKYTIIISIIALFIIFILLGPFYTVQETQTAVITLFNKPVRTVLNAGLHFKIPLIENVNYFSKQILEWDGEPRQFPTYDKRMILIDTTVRWRIVDPLKFFVNLTNELEAKARLDDILDSASRKIVSQHSFEEIVRDSNRIKNLNQETIKLLKEFGVSQEEIDSYPTIKAGRSDLSNEMLMEVKEKILKEMGIEIMGFFIKNVNYIEDNLNSVYQSMIAERKKIAQSYRSQGEKYRQEKLGEMEQKAKEILSEARKEAKIIMANADSKASEIYNNAYNRSPQTREFYEFLKKMEVYKKIPKTSSFIISTESDFFDMLKKYK